MSCDEDCRHHWRMLRHSTAEETSNPGGRSPSRCRKGTCWAACGGRSSRTAHPSGRATEYSEAGLVIHHSWRRTLTQCRARYHISEPPSRMAEPYASSFLSARGLVSAHLLGGRRTRVSILDSLAGSGRFCWHWSGLAGSDVPNAAALTLRIDLAARIPFRAVERLVSPTHRTFGPWFATASMVSR